MDDRTAERIGKNDATFRQLNEQLSDVERRQRYSIVQKHRGSPADVASATKPARR